MAVNGEDERSIEEEAARKGKEKKELGRRWCLGGEQRGLSGTGGTDGRGASGGW